MKNKIENILDQHARTRPVTIAVRESIINRIDKSNYPLSRSKILKMALEVGIEQVEQALRDRGRNNGG